MEERGLASEIPGLGVAELLLLGGEAGGRDIDIDRAQVSEATDTVPEGVVLKELQIGCVQAS